MQVHVHVQYSVSHVCDCCELQATRTNSTFMLYSFDNVDDDDSDS